MGVETGGREGRGRGEGGKIIRKRVFFLAYPLVLHSIGGDSKGRGQEWKEEL